MAIAFVGGDKLVLNKEYVTAAANLADKSLVLVGGTVPSSAAGLSYGVVEKDTASGDLATVKNGTGSILEVLCTGTVTAGSKVEVLTASVYANISGTSTSITAAGVSVLSSGFPVGLAHTSSDAGGTALIEWQPGIPKGAIA